MYVININIYIVETKSKEFPREKGRKCHGKKKYVWKKKENKEIRVKNQINNEIRRNGDAFSHLLCELTPFFSASVYELLG